MKETLNTRIYRAKQAIIQGWRECMAGELPESSVRDRISHYLWLKDHKKKR